MLELQENFDDANISKGLSLLGLKLSESELAELLSGSCISLGNRELSEIGSLFILAATLSSVNTGNRTKIAFEDLLKFFRETAPCSGIPIYSWTDSPKSKYNLYLTFAGCKPAVCLAEIRTTSDLQITKPHSVMADVIA